MPKKKPSFIKRFLYTYDSDDPGGRKLSLGVYLIRVFLVLMALEGIFYFFTIVHYFPTPLTPAEIAAKVPPRESPFPHKNIIEFLKLINDLYLFGAAGVYGMFTGGNVWAKRYTNQPGSFESGFNAGGGEGEVGQQIGDGNVTVNIAAKKPPAGAPGEAAVPPVVSPCGPTKPPVKIAGAQKATTTVRDDP